MSEPTDGNWGENNLMSKGWLNWANRHRGMVAIGAVVVGILMFSQARKLSFSGRGPGAEDQPGGEETPLFI